MATRFAKQPDWTHAVLAGERPSTRDVYGVLLAWRPWHDDANGRPCHTATPARSVIAEQAGVTERMVRYATARLVELGLIRKRHRGRGRAQVYFLAWDAPFTADADPVLMMAAPVAGAPVDDAHEKGKKGKWDPVDDAEKGKPIAPFRPEKGKPIAPYREDSSKRTSPPVLPRSLPTAREAVESNGGGSENQTNHDDPIAAELAAAVEKIRRVYLRGVWPAHPSAVDALGAWLADGWPRDQIGQYLADKIASVAVRDPAAVVKAALTAGPPPAPVVPDHARPTAWHARREALSSSAPLPESRPESALTPSAPDSPPTPVKSNGAGNGRVATGATGASPVSAPDVLTGMFTRLFTGMTRERVLDPSEGRTRDMAATGTEG